MSVEDYWQRQREFLELQEQEEAEASEDSYTTMGIYKNLEDTPGYEGQS